MFDCDCMCRCNVKKFVFVCVLFGCCVCCLGVVCVVCCEMLMCLFVDGVDDDGWWCERMCEMCVRIDCEVCVCE